MKVVGIDPGLKGGLALIENGTLLGAIPMPLIKGKLNNDRVARILRNDAPDWVFLERVHAMYGSSAKSTFSFGSGFGAIQGILSALGIKYVLVDPKVWQRVAHEGTGEKNKTAKEKSAIAAMRLFPGFDFRGHDGMVDAALIALYGYRWSSSMAPGAQKKDPPTGSDTIADSHLVTQE